MAVARHALVTGCSRGIGLAVTEALLGDGWHVHGAARNAPAIEHSAFRFVETDVAQLRSVERLRDTIEAELAGSRSTPSSTAPWSSHPSARSR